ncbi:MAG: WxL domain-containing protein [Eubacterium sp.]|nr:WxL domain-containing protein [Eubacterium sp.]
MKKVFSLLLSFVMVLSIASAVNLFAYADENDTEITEEVTEPAEPTNPVDPEEPTDPVNPEAPTEKVYH